MHWGPQSSVAWERYSSVWNLKDTLMNFSRSRQIGFNYFFSAIRVKAIKSISLLNSDGQPFAMQFFNSLSCSIGQKAFTGEKFNRIFQGPFLGKPGLKEFLSFGLGSPACFGARKTIFCPGRHIIK